MSSHRPFFSIIIPTLNEEQFLPKLLRSLSRQTSSDFEVIIVDGRSVDKTEIVAHKFSKKLPEFSYYLVNKQNVSYQRNFGAKRAKGKYLVFFDADTQIPPSFLAQVVKEIDRGAVFLTTYFKPDSQNVSDDALMRLVNLIIELGNIIGKPFVVGANTIIKKSVFDKVGGFDDYVRHAEDYTFTQKVKDAKYPLCIIRTTKAVFSLRRYRVEGRLTVLRKNARAAMHLLTSGPITRELFSYPMGGRRYVTLKTFKEPLNKKTIAYLEKQVRKTVKKLFQY